MVDYYVVTVWDKEIDEDGKKKILKVERYKHRLNALYLARIYVKQGCEVWLEYVNRKGVY